MEYTNAANEYVGSPVFSVLMVLGVIGLGLVLRMAFRSGDSEYVHKPDE